MGSNNAALAVTDMITEVEALRATRIVLEQQRKTIDTWFTTKQQEYDTLHKQTLPHVTSTTTSHTPKHTPPFLPDTPIKFKKDLYEVFGYIMENNKYKNGKWYFEVFTMNGTTIHDCCEDHLTPLTDNIPPDVITSRQSPLRKSSDDICSPVQQGAPSPPPFRHGYPHIKQEMSTSSEPPIHHNSSWPKVHRMTTRPLAQNEFEYPIGSLPLSVNQTTLIKHAEKWNFDIQHVLDLRGFYDTLINHFRPYHIYLRPYNEIQKDEGLQLIDAKTCVHSEVALTQMSQAIMIFFQTYGHTIFKKYSEPLEYIAAFKATSNGLGYLTRIMKKRHPRLKDVINMETPPAPSFSHFQNIHIFIQAYIEWLHDEKLRNDREYNDKEKLDHVLNNLDDRFQIALLKIATKIDSLFADPSDPQPIPPHLQVTNNLGMYITDLIPDDKKEDLTNTNIPKVFAVNTRSNTHNFAPRKSPRSTKDKYKHRQNPGEIQSRDRDIDVDNLERKIIPGATCPACGKNNHNVYKTGCPALGLFANCQDFYKSQPKNLIDKVQHAFNKYQSELGKKMLERRNKDRRILRTVAATCGEDQVNDLKDSMFHEYKSDFSEEQYITDNPYDDFYFDETSDTDDQTDMSE